MSRVEGFTLVLTIVVLVVVLLARVIPQRPLFPDSSGPECATPQPETGGWTHIRSRLRTSTPELLPIPRVDPDCPRFAMVDFNTFAGAGHLFGDYLLTLALARALDAVPLYGDAIEDHASVLHGSSVWLKALLALDEGDYYFSEVVRQYKARLVEPGSWWEAVENYREACNVIVTLDDSRCSNDPAWNGDVKYCFGEIPSVYEEAKWLLRNKYLSFSTYRPSRIEFDPQVYNVAWHLRIGDVSLYKDNRALFETVHNQLSQRVLHDLPVHHFFFFECAKENGLAPADCNNLPEGFEYLDELMPNITAVGDMDPALTMYHFINADMLIETGSSFPMIAHTITTKAVVLEFVPKEGQFLDTYEVSELVHVNELGVIQEPLEQLRARVLYQHSLYKGILIP